MNLTGVLQSHRERLVDHNRQMSFSSEEQYLYNYFDASFRFLSSFETLRLQQAKITCSGETMNSLEALNRSQNYERQCALSVEVIYVYVHRIELVIRHSQQMQDRIAKHSGFDTITMTSWLAELRFMSETRNKVMEHAPQNLTFQSQWGQIFDCNDPFDFRLWILHPNAIGILQNDQSVRSALEAACSKIYAHKVPNPMPTLGKIFDLVDGSYHLDTKDIMAVFKDALTTVGCVSSKPTLIAAKLSNLFQFVFGMYRD